VRSFRYVLVDVFTDKPLQGNQLAVFTDARDLDPLTMQALAKEMGFSETVFCLPPSGGRLATQPQRADETAEQDASHREDDVETVYVLPPREGGHARIRIFTPRTEIPFAGHPCLGAAFVLAAPLQLETIALETGSGIVPVQLDRDESGRIVFGRMVQPVPSVAPFERVDELLAALGVRGSELPVEVYDNGGRQVYVRLGSKAAVAALDPDLRALMAQDLLGVNVFAGEGTRWKTRMFSPFDGVGEDAATGSAAGPLACHLARHGVISWGEQIEISQGAEIGRPSTLYARASGSSDGIESVEVGGSAVTVARGEFRIP
jgi:trans-2,3-dihydro-3-hydroxyanthranilate isomerase